MKSNYTRVMRLMSTAPWAIEKSTLETICAIIEARVNGAPSFTTDEIRAHMGARAAAGSTLQASGTIAVIPLVGVLAPKLNLMTNMSGGTGLDQFRSQFRRALADATVKAIVIAVDSPGGQVIGCRETFAEILAARGTKPIVASVDALMASAALWIGSACDAIEMTPSGSAGSLGVYCVHEDYSEAEAKAGIKITYIAAGISPFKTEGNQDEPLSESARAHIQGKIDDVAATFLDQVATGRGLPAKQVQQTFGGGRMLSADEALAVKMIDRIATFEQTIARLMGSGQKSRGAAAAAETTGRECHCGPACGCAQNGFCPTDCATCQPGCVCLESAPHADHTDTGRDGAGKFSAQCECDPACPCMQDGSDLCPPECLTCQPTCACLKSSMATAQRASDEDGLLASLV